MLYSQPKRVVTFSAIRDYRWLHINFTPHKAHLIQCDQIKIDKCLYKLPKIDSTRKMKDFETFTKIAYKHGNLGKIIITTGFEKLPKGQYITQSGHTDLIRA